MTRKAFTVEEADALIPVLEEVFARLDGERERLQRRADQVQALDLIWGDRLLETDCPDHAEAMLHQESLQRSIAAIEELVRTEIQERGLRLPQGGLEHGLVDFPTTWDGRWVLLCWQRGEPSLQAWHEVDGGFAGRRALTPAQARRMGREDDPHLLGDPPLDL